MFLFFKIFLMLIIWMRRQQILTYRPFVLVPCSDIRHRLKKGNLRMIIMIVMTHREGHDRG